MNYQSRLKISIGWYYPIGILISNIIVIAEIVIRTNFVREGEGISMVPYITYSMASLFFITLGIIQLIRYRNWIYPVLGLLLGIGTFQASFAIFGQSDIIKATYFTTVVVIILFVIINWNLLYSHERFEVNSRRLFRLASERIYETSDGYTERPFVAGRIQCTRDELLGFARYMHAKYIARPFYYDDSVHFAFSMNTSLVVIGEASEVSHVVIDHSGSIKVKISERDYSDYKKRLNFDQLCSSMANLFVRFMDYYSKGLESRIMTELKSA